MQNERRRERDVIALSATHRKPGERSTVKQKNFRSSGRPARHQKSSRACARLPGAVWELTASAFSLRGGAWGASLRASQFLIFGGKARAILRGRYNVSCEDVRAVAPAVLRHRVLLNFQAEAEKVDSDQVIKRLIETVPEPKSGL